MAPGLGGSLRPGLSAAVAGDAGVFGAAAFLLPNAWDKFYAALLLAVHVGGCTGDLWNTLLYLTRFRDPRTLTRDTGPLQSFYVPEAQDKGI